MPDILLSCGCRANSISKGKPSCLVHAGLGIDINPVPDPDLTGRKAKCTCCSTFKPSSLSLWFFEFRGEGSPDAIHTCKNCGFYDSAHTPEKQLKNEYICKNFEAHGAWDYDLFYCSCRGCD